ncbi:MAG: DUF1127 domain-containing protein [Rhodovibrionaceae bacterium]
MKRLTANEIDTLRSDRALMVTSDQTYALVREARRLQAQTLRIFLVKLGGGVADLTGLNLLNAKLRRAVSRRKTYYALATLSDRNLSDIGLHRSGIESKAIEMSRENVPATSCFWSRLARRWREDNDRRRTVRELLSMDDRILADIGFERSQVWDIAEELTRKRGLLSRAVASIATPIAALAQEFETLVNRPFGFGKLNWQPKSPANDTTSAKTEANQAA